MALSILDINVNYSVTAACVFYFSWLANWTSPWTWLSKFRYQNL